LSTKSKAKPRVQRAIVEECVCCHVNFDSNVCPQCHAAGCTHKAKGSACLLHAAVVAARKLTPQQMTEKIADLQRELRHITAEAQRLGRIVQDYEANWPKGMPRLEFGVTKESAAA
jgi:hypothetical protein